MAHLKQHRHGPGTDVRPFDMFPFRLVSDVLQWTNSSIHPLKVHIEDFSPCPRPGICFIQDISLFVLLSYMVEKSRLLLLTLSHLFVQIPLLICPANKIAEDDWHLLYFSNFTRNLFTANYIKYLNLEELRDSQLCHQCPVYTTVHPGCTERVVNHFPDALVPFSHLVSVPHVDNYSKGQFTAKSRIHIFLLPVRKCYWSISPVLNKMAQKSSEWVVRS